MNNRLALAFVHDLVVTAAAWYLAFLFRFNFELAPRFFDDMLLSLVWVLPIQGIVSCGLNLYRGIWRFASLNDLKRIVLAAVFGAMGCSLAFAMLQMHGPVPRSVLVLYPVLLVMMMGGSRLAYRAWKERRITGLVSGARRVLVLGAGEAGARLVAELNRSREWVPVGLLDDNPKMHGRMMHDVRVLGVLDDLPAVASRLNVEHAVMAMPSVSHSVRRRIVEAATRNGISMLTVPSFEDLMSGKVTVSQIRQVELEDLLGRDPVILDTEGLAEFLGGKVVMVTGAGGSIGSEFCRQIARFRPAQLVLYELSEYALYLIEQEFRNSHPDIPVACVVGDVKDPARVSQVLGKFRPMVVFHAAAYKHVPLMEQENAWEAVRNNALGTQVLAAQSIRHGVEKFVLISTDKAVNPTSVMGASKRLAEMICQALQTASGTHFVTVRFGNVLGSTGSVVPLFREQIVRGGPVAVTHPDVTRYFMSIPEAAQLVLQAGLMGQGGEIYVLDMGEPVKIVDLARTMIRLSGFSEEDVRITFTGLRPGEKLYEEVLADGEKTLPTPHPKLRIARSRAAPDGLPEAIGRWVAGAPCSDQEVRGQLREWLPEYNGS